MSERSPQLSFKFALLHLIEETDRFARETKTLKDWFGADFAEKSGFAKLYDDSCRSINEGLQQIGGFEVTIDATETNPELLIKLIEWRGKHPDAPDRYKWLGYHVASQHRVDVTLGAEAIQEIREKLLVEAVS